MTTSLQLSLLASVLFGCTPSATPIVETSQQPPAFVWWEAEKPKATNFPDRHAFFPANAQEADVLSAGAWIGADGPRPSTLFLEYDVEVPEAGEYFFYVRRFWQHGPYRWRFNDGDWNSVEGEIPFLDNAPMRQHLGANWTYAGSIRLNRGTNSLRIESLTNDGAICFDCFLLTRGSFVARGKLKPNERLTSSTPGFFAFDPGEEDLRSPMNLRHLNERVAGENGRIISRDGRFIHSRTGRPVRFWGVNAGPSVAKLPVRRLESIADLLAARGVNLVRLHGSIFAGEGPRTGEINRDQIARLRQFSAILKTRGIYTTLSFYFPLWMRLDATQGWPGYNNQHPFGIIFWDDRFQAMHRGWMRELLTSTAGGGPSFAEDPAVLSFEIVNEDSLFFWTFTPYENIPVPYITDLEDEFGSWLTRRYGSVQNALTTWNSEAIRGDDRPNGRAGIAPLWRLFNNRDLRSRDTTAFLTEVKSNFYRDTRHFIQSALGFRGLISGTNWTTADARYLTPLERYANTYAGFIDRHGYYGGVQEGTTAGYQIDPGHTYFSRSLVRAEGERPGGTDFFSPLLDTQFNDLPTMLSEVDWPEPNRWRAEQPYMGAAYSALQDLDAIIWFTLHGDGWQTMLSKWPFSTPAMLGQSTATALMYRTGLIQEGPVVADMSLNTTALKALSGAPVAQGDVLDAIRKADLPVGQTVPIGDAGLDPRTHHVGRVRVTFQNERASTVKFADLPKYIDETRGSVRSATGQLQWDYRLGLLRINAPGAQGAVGELAKNGKVVLQNIEVESALPWGAISVVSMDGQPLAQSRKMLLQVMSEQTNDRWRTSGEGILRIEDLGRMPIVVREFQGVVRIKRTDANSLVVTPLALNGTPIAAGRKRGAATIQLLPNVMHYVIEPG